jgi:hypothetical protein
MIEILGCAITLIINGYSFVQLLRKGPGDLRDARNGRNLTLVMAAILTSFGAYNFSVSDWIAGTFCAVLVALYCVTVFIVNRYIDREESKLDRTTDLDWW